MIVNAETTEMLSLRIFEENEFNSFRNGGTDYGLTIALTTEKPVKLAVSQDLGGSFKLYKITTSGGSNLDLDEMNGKILIDSGHIHLCGTNGDMIRCLVHRISDAYVSSFKIFDNSNTYVKPRTMTMIFYGEIDTGVAFNFKNSGNNKFMHGFMRWDHDG